MTEQTGIFHEARLDVSDNINKHSVKLVLINVRVHSPPNFDQLLFMMSTLIF